MKARAVLILVAALLCASCSRADSWSAPRVQIVASPDGATIARIVPSEGGAGGSQAKAVILKFSPASGGYTKVAEFTLRNPSAPHAVVVTDGAEFLVTFDDWAQLGRTENTVVVYRGSGEILKAWSLADIFSAEDRKSFISSVSSTWWRGEVSVLPDIQGRPVVIVAPESRVSALHEGPKVGYGILLDLDTLSFRKR